jgi:hypothetical protein
VFLKQLLHFFPVLAVFITFNPVIKPLFSFILQLFTQYLVNLQAIAQRLPFP